MSYPRYNRYDQHYSSGSSGLTPFSTHFRPFSVYASQEETSSRNQQSMMNIARHDPFCRACKEFQDWVGKNQNQFQRQNRSKPPTPSNDSMAARAGGCPLDREELGRNSWAVLHSFAGYFPERPSVDQQREMEHFINLFGKYFPCTHCSEDFMKMIKVNPPDTSSRQRFAKWLCDAHNKVNAKLGKPQYDCSLVEGRWHGGFADGSCD